MALSDDDVREILRLIDDSELSELRIETEGLSLHVVRGGPAPAQTVEEGAPPAATADGAGGTTIEAPMLGVFYRAPSPGAAPFVDVGTAVDDHTTVCMIEVMKLMNSIPAGIRGVVTHVLVADATPVETDQPLIVVQPELPPP